MAVSAREGPALPPSRGPRALRRHGAPFGGHAARGGRGRPCGRGGGEGQALPRGRALRPLQPRPRGHGRFLRGVRRPRGGRRRGRGSSRRGARPHLPDGCRARAEPDRAFMRLWCRKESYLKLRGCGLEFEPSAISAEPGSSLGREARFFEYHLRNYVLCVCAWAEDSETGAPCCTFAPHEGGLAHHG